MQFEFLGGLIPRDRLNLSSLTLGKNQLVRIDLCSHRILRGHMSTTLLRDLLRSNHYHIHGMFYLLQGLLTRIYWQLNCLLYNLERGFKVVRWSRTFIEPLENLMRLVYLVLGVSILMLLEKLDHERVMMELDETAHWFRPRLRHINRAYIRLWVLKMFVEGRAHFQHCPAVFPAGKIIDADHVGQMRHQ